MKETYMTIKNTNSGHERWMCAKAKMERNKRDLRTKLLFINQIQVWVSEGTQQASLAKRWNGKSEQKRSIIVDITLLILAEQGQVGKVLLHQKTYKVKTFLWYQFYLIKQLYTSKYSITSQ